MSCREELTITSVTPSQVFELAILTTLLALLTSTEQGKKFCRHGIKPRNVYTQGFDQVDGAQYLKLAGGETRVVEINGIKYTK